MDVLGWGGASHAGEPPCGHTDRGTGRRAPEADLESVAAQTRRKPPATWDFRGLSTVAQTGNRATSIGRRMTRSMRERLRVAPGAKPGPTGARLTEPAMRDL